jgi:hypothetical protein
VAAPDPWYACGTVGLSLNTLVEQLDDLFFERSMRTWRIASGIQREAAPVLELPELVRLDAWQALQELLSSPRVDESKRARLALLKRHVARAHVEAHAQEVNERLETVRNNVAFEANARFYTSDEAEHALPRLASRDERLSLAAAYDAHLLTHQALVAQRIDLTQEGIHDLQLTPTTFIEELHGRPVGPRRDAAVAVLAETADPHADLLGYGLRKMDPGLTQRPARWADAERVALAPWLFDSFRQEDLSHALSRCLGDLGLSPNADGRVTLDFEARPGRDPRPRCVELRVPDQIRVLLTPDLGCDAFAGWLSHWAMALHRAHVGRSLPFVERRLGDRSVIAAIGVLFESFLLDEGWLKRYLRLTANQAKEAARAFAFRQLHQLRHSAVLAGYSSHAMDKGSTSGVPDEYMSLLNNAASVEGLRGHALLAIDGFGDQLLQLDAYALEHVMSSSLRERFNEDFWRNPATGRWLVELAGRGQRDDAVSVAQQLHNSQLSLSAAAQYRVAVMGA